MVSAGMSWAHEQELNADRRHGRDELERSGGGRDESYHGKDACRGQSEGGRALKHSFVELRLRGSLLLGVGQVGRREIVGNEVREVVAVRGIVDELSWVR